MKSKPEVPYISGGDYVFPFLVVVSYIIFRNNSVVSILCLHCCCGIFDYLN